MRILVADDEALARFSLISILEDLLEEPPTILEASNGRELVERTKESRPHIGFVDIRMPHMDGLEAISEARRFAPRALWVIVSGHGDFENAREALKLGVEDFLVKPVDPDELRNLIGRLTTKARNRQRRGNRELEAKVSAVLGSTASPEFDDWFSRPRFWQAAMIFWDTAAPDEDLMRRRRRYAGRLQAILDEGDDYSGCVVSCSEEALLAVLSMPTGGLPDHRSEGATEWWSFGSHVEGGLPMDMVINLWRRRFESLRLAGRDITADDIGDTWLLTRVVQDPVELFREVESLRNGGGLRFIHRPAEMGEYSDVTARVATSRFLELAETLKDMRDVYLYGAEDDFHGLAHRMQEQLEKQEDGFHPIGGAAWYSRFVVPLAPPLPADLGDLATRLHDESHSLFSGRPTAVTEESGGRTLADRALEVMNRRYRETVGIAQVAEELGVTANYLSTVFKKEIGTGFTRKMTELRLSKARDLLSRPDANIGEIAQSLGYQSSRHFTRLFKDRFGITPSRWMAGGSAGQE